MKGNNKFADIYRAGIQVRQYLTTFSTFPVMRWFSKQQKSLNDLSDTELVSQYQHTEETRYVGELYKRYTHLVYGLCLKYLQNPEDSQDAVMEIFENLMTTLLNQDVRNFQSWLLTVTKNSCLMRLRAQKSRTKRHQNFLADVGSFMELVDDVHPNSGLESEWDAFCLEKALKELKDEQRTCIEMFYYQGKTYQEIAAESGYPQKKVKSSIQNGKRNLHNMLAKVT